MLRPADEEKDLLNQMKLDGPHLAEGAPACEKRDIQPNLTGASHAIGQLLGMVWDDPCMERDELASAMCFEALLHDVSLMTLEEILSASGLKLRRGQSAVKDLMASGFVRARHPSTQDLARGESTIRYELWSPLARVLNS